jgi:hypothetical protein
VLSSGRVYPFGSCYLLRDGEELTLYGEQFKVAAAQKYNKIGAVKAVYPVIYLAAVPPTDCCSYLFASFFPRL